VQTYIQSHHRQEEGTVPSIETVRTPPRAGPVALKANGSQRRIRPYPSRAEAIERLEQLRSVVPVFAQELVSARRHAAQLRVENSWLIEQVRQLERGRA
jgi:hypothetical protein